MNLQPYSTTITLSVDGTPTMLLQQKRNSLNWNSIKLFHCPDAAFFIERQIITIAIPVKNNLVIFAVYDEISRYPDFAIFR